MQKRKVQKTVSKTPAFMQAMEIHDGKLRACSRSVPKPRKGEVLIRVRAAGINRPDILQRKGFYPPPPGVTDIPGLEVAGDIVRFGTGTQRQKLKTGQAVVALVAGGGYAEYVCVPVEQCLPVPKGMAYDMAACLPETFFTVWTNLVDGGQLKKNEVVLIHGGSSGIGTTAIQIAKKIIGAKVIITAGSDKKCATCTKLGAKAINYKKKDFVKDVLTHTRRKGVDVVLDMVGGDYVPRNITCLAPKGRHVSIAVQGGRETTLDISQIMKKQLVLTGSTLRPRTAPEKGKIAQALLKHVWPALSQKRIKPVLCKSFSLREAQAAHDWLESGKNIGKVVLMVD